MSCVMPPIPYKRKADEHLKPLYELDEKQREVLEQFRQTMNDVTGKEKLWADDACLIRYLRARDYQIAAAEKLLRGTLSWRRTYGIETVNPDEIDEEARSGKNYLHGTDRSGRPVIYQRPRRQNTTDYANQVRQMAYLLERSVLSMDLSRGVESHILIIDFKGYSIFNAPPMSVTKQVLSLLMDRYPERLGAAFLVDAPMLFTTSYRVLKPFIPAATKKKIFFVSRPRTIVPGELDPSFAEYFDPDQLEEEYGGTLSSNYDHEAYFAFERKVFSDKKKQAEIEQEQLVSQAQEQEKSAKGFDIEAYLQRADKVDVQVTAV